jgi:pimeloyl-ACP methyl ester carboxylesterase
VLGHSDFGVTDNFFLVGGHSLSSARLTGLIEQRLGRLVPVSVLFQQPTLRELSQWLAAADPLADSRGDGPVATAADRPAAVAGSVVATIDGPASTSGYRSLVTLQARGEAPGLFVVHGGNGDVYIHLHLARCLAPHRPVLGLQAVGFDGSAERQRSVAEMAAHYADEILRFQPKGPYHLLGYSGGGWYAWAVAAELRRRGADPGLIGLVDTGSTADLHRRMRLRQLIRRQLQHLPRRARALVDVDPGRWPSALARKGKALRYIAWTLLRPQGGTAPQVLDPEARPRPTQPLRGDYFLQLHTYYRPPRLPLRTHVFASRGQQHQLENLWNFYARGQALLHPCLEEHEDYYNADLMPEFALLLETILGEIEAEAKR